MKLFKRYLFYFAAVLTSLSGLVACNSFFDYPESAAFDEDEVFSKWIHARKLVYQMYVSTPDAVLFNLEEPFGGPMLDCITDGGSAFSGNSNYGSHRFNNGSLNSVNVTNARGEYRYDVHWADIRVAYTLLERIHEVPDVEENERLSVIAECKTMIALRYYEMFKRFGGVPIVRKRLQNPAEFKIGRSTLQETYDFIMGLLDEAIAEPNFAATDFENTGRLTKTVAYALQARMKLWAASPLFNTSTPYSSLGEHNDLICFGNEDKERWKASADAAKQTIDYCEANGISIVGQRANPEPNKSVAMKNYITVTQHTRSDGNMELIWGMIKLNSTIGSRKGLMMRGQPQSGWAINVATQNHVEKYRQTDGTFVDWSHTIVSAPNNPDEPYEKLEPRFHASIVYNGKMFYPGNMIEAWDSGEEGVDDGKNGPLAAKSEYVYGVHKFVHGYEDQQISKITWLVMSPNMRLAEFYFQYAESLNEYDFAANRTEIFNALNKVLYRSGMSVPSTINSQEEMREFIVRERAIEFYFEAQRYFDCKRWLRGNDLANNIYDLQIKKYKNGTFSFEKVVREKRIWKDYYYLWPFPQSEINKNYGLIQNPEWN